MNARLVFACARSGAAPVLAGGGSASAEGSGRSRTFSSDRASCQRPDVTGSRLASIRAVLLGAGGLGAAAVAPSAAGMRAVVLAVAVILVLAGCAVARIGAPPPVPDPTPTEVRIPAIGVVAEVLPLGLDEDGRVAPPPVEKPELAGWFTGGPRPGEPGVALILGHVGAGGQAGVFARIGELVAGDEVQVEGADGDTVWFVVERVARVPEPEFPTGDVNSDTDVPELRLITCGDRDSDRDSVVVYATMAD